MKHIILTFFILFIFFRLALPVARGQIISSDVKDTCSIFFPSLIFTDKFPKLILRCDCCGDTFSFMMFDRWGNRLYKTDKYNDTLDLDINEAERVNNKSTRKFCTGTYFYIINYGIRMDTGTLMLVKSGSLRIIHDEKDFFDLAFTKTWIRKDKRVIKRLIMAYKNDSIELSGFFQKRFVCDTINWGQDYYSVEKHKQAGTIGINVSFLYFKDKLLGYRISSDMPDNRELREKYKKWYSGLFKFTDSFNILPIYSNYDRWIEPLPEYDGYLKIEEQSELFRDYFSVNSGSEFGCNDGWYGMHENCRLFNELLPELNPDKIYLLMFSKNSITRMYAFYYFLTHKSQFQNAEKIENWMNTILQNHPLIRYAYFDRVTMEDPKKILDEYVKSYFENK